jgi:hypothetical protein
VADAVKVFLLTLSALFPIVDPLTGSPIFLPSPSFIRENCDEHSLGEWR